MPGWLRTMLAAAIGGCATAAALLAAGAVESGERVTVLGSPGPVKGAPALTSAAVLGAREIYTRGAPGVVFIRARTLRTGPTPFDIVSSPRPTESTGSGFVIDEDGLILTNAHVVEAATDVQVTFSDRRTVSAKPVGKDAETDLALLRVDPGALDLDPLELGDSGTVQVGDPTVAIGNPSGRERTLTTGVVSALQRRLTAPSGFTIDAVIQTDAALNPGNSGGPLLDAAGRVIGISSQLSTGDGAGIGFAVPVNTAKRVIPELERAGRVAHAYLGIQGRGADDGVLVGRIEPGSPAASAGVRAADVLLELDGQAIRSMDDVSAVLARRAPGDVVDVEVRTDGRQRGLEATLAERAAGG